MAKSPPSIDLSGPWAGVYAYAHHPRAEHFDAVLHDAGGALTGTRHENARLLVPARKRDATIEGWHKAGEVHFVKTYDASAGDGFDPIVYAGHTDADSTEIAGIWSIRDWSGTFLMIRQQPKAKEVAERRLAEIDAKR